MSLTRYERPCMFCGRKAVVLASDNADELDVDAEFCGAGRAFGDEDEILGVGCYRCSKKRWTAERSLERAKRSIT